MPKQLIVECDCVGLRTINGSRRYLGIGRTSFYGLLNSGEFEDCWIGGRRLISQRSLAQFIERVLDPSETDGAEWPST